MHLRMLCDKTKANRRIRPHVTTHPTGRETPPRQKRPAALCIKRRPLVAVTVVGVTSL